MDPMNKKALRERMAALNSEEVKLACETLVWMDPERYIKELGKYVMMLKLDMEDVAFVVNHRQSVKDRVTGEVMETEPVAFSEKIDEEHKDEEPFYNEEVINALEPINDIVNKALNNPVNLKVPDFIKNKREDEDKE